MINLPPLLLEPRMQQKVWGGTTFVSSSPGLPIGEVWAISGRVGNASKILSEHVPNSTLDAFYAEHGPLLCGDRSPHSEFPLLCKFIDAQDHLSVQVHPNDDQAQQGGYGPCGKTECWYIVDAAPGAEIIAGFKPGVTKDVLLAHLADQSIESILDRFPIAPGDMLFIPAGCVHAILKGTIIYEVQQSSDTTMRFYDWNRNAIDRPLHIEQSLSMVYYGLGSNRPVPPCVKKMVGPLVHQVRSACRFFCVEEIYTAAAAEVVVPAVNSCVTVSVLMGDATLLTDRGTLQVGQYGSACMPADIGPLTFQFDKESRILIAYIPDLIADVVEPLLENDYSHGEIVCLAGPALDNDIARLLTPLGSVFNSHRE